MLIPASAVFQELVPSHDWRWSGGYDGGGGDWGAGAEGGDDDYQVVYLPALLPREAQLSSDRSLEDVPFPYNFDAFGRYDNRLFTHVVVSKDLKFCARFVKCICLVSLSASGSTTKNIETYEELFNLGNQRAQ